MARIVAFQTDGAATAGFGQETVTLQTFFQELTNGIAILDVTQVAGAVLANDADWQLYVDGQATRWTWRAEEIDPASVGRNRLLTPIRIHRGALIQFRWSGQGAAQANTLTVQYERIP